MTFTCSHEGVVHQQNLGADTAKTAECMKSYDPRPGGWSKVDVKWGDAARR
jgi:hypothetical protein